MKRHSYQKYEESKPTLTKQVINRKMFIILDIRKKPLVSREGHLYIFYRSKDANSFIYRNKASTKWRVKIVQLDITTL